MMLSRRGAFKYAMSATALAALGGLAASTGSPNARANGPRTASVNVKNFGATGDGTTDDTASIHSARDAAGVGGKIIFPPGTYTVSGLKASAAGQIWELSDRAIIRTKSGAPTAILITGVDVSIVGGVFDISNGTTHDWSQNGIKVAADGVAIRDAKIHNSPAFGICAFNHNRLTISGCTLLDNYYGGIFVQNSLAGPSNIFDITITENVVRSSSGQEASGIAVRGDSLTQLVNQVSINDNAVHLPYNQSGETGGIAVTCGADWEVRNNVVSGGFLGITCPNSTRATISDNVVYGFSMVGIEIPGVVENVTVARNVVESDGTSAGSGIQASAGAISDVRIVSNVIKNFAADCYLISFSSGSVSQRVIISGNTLTSSVQSGSFTAVYFNGSVTGLSMSGNVVDGYSSPKSSGVRFLKSVAKASINANLFANLSDAAVRIEASDPGDILDYINVAGNAVVNCGAAFKDLTANGAIVGNNIVI